MSLARSNQPDLAPRAQTPVSARRNVIALAPIAPAALAALAVLVTLSACYQDVVLDPDNLFATGDTSQDTADDTASDTAPAVTDDDDTLPDDDDVGAPDDDDDASNDDDDDTLPDDDDVGAPDDDDDDDDNDNDDDDDSTDSGDTGSSNDDDDDDDTGADTGDACPETWNLLCPKGIQLTCKIPEKYDPPPLNGLLDGLYDWLNTAPDTCFASGTPDWLACEPLFIPPALLPNNAWRDRFPWHGGDCRSGLLPTGTARGDTLQCALVDEWPVTTAPPLPTLICQNVSGIF